MPTGDHSDGASEHETQFVYQPGDEDVLWAVQEITAERGNKYKVRWAGVDPTTNRPWAQSWVAKRDCTDDLVVEWKRKKRGKGQKGGGRTSAASGSASRRTGSTSGATTTRRSTTSERVASVEEEEEEPDVVAPSPPPPKATTSKRKRAETPVEDRRDVHKEQDKGKGKGKEREHEQERPRKKPRTTVDDRRDDKAQNEDERKERERPRKKTKTTVDDRRNAKEKERERERPRMKTMVDVLLPPLSSDDESEGEGGRVESSRANAEERHGRARPKGSARVEVRVPSAATQTETKTVSRRKAPVVIELSDASEAADEALRPPKFKSRTPPVEDEDGPSENENVVDLTTRSIKIGPPRGAKRQPARETGRFVKTGEPPREAKRQRGRKGGRLIMASPTEARGEEERQVSTFGSPLRLQDAVDDLTRPARRVSIPEVPPSTGPYAREPSPGTIARLELFERMTAEPAQSLANDIVVPDHVDPPPPLAPQSKPKPKPSKQATPNGLIVPETESSGNSQSQSQPQPLPEPPPPPPPPPQQEPPPRKPVDLPAIAVIVPSATSSSGSPPPQKLPPPASRPAKKPTFTVAPRLTVTARARVADPDPPPSSIESFSSPRFVNKGKQRAIEEDLLQSSLSDGEHQKRRAQKMTDSHLKKRGKELYEEAQRAREVEWGKNKKPKRLKAIQDIVNGAPSSSRRPLFSSTSAPPENILEDTVEASGGANSATLDTPGHSEVRPMSEEDRQRLRIELRQEEEESTQEAMGVFVPPPADDVLDGDPCMPPPRSPKVNHGQSDQIVNGHVDDVDHVEQPSVDLVQASVMVQASQERRHEDTEMEVLLSNRPASSPPRPVPDNLTDAPNRRLGEALSLLNVKSEEIQRLERELADERKNLQGLKAELAELQQSSEPTPPVRAAWDAERAQWAQERSKWEKDFSAWETQRKEMSQEKETLSTRLAELLDAAARAEQAEAKLSALEAEHATWTRERDVMVNDATQQSGALAQVRVEYDQDRSKWETEKTSWAEEKVEWEAERAALSEKQQTSSRSVDELTASVESIKAAKISADKDRDFFREQYSQASAFVESVRDENTELEKRVEIAEGQAREGVAAIKTLFEGRVKALQDDLARWKGLTALLQEKDMRTNDELRLRAAQAPELGELCDKLKVENKSLEAEVRRLSHAQQRDVHRRNRLFYEILLLKKERATLRSKLSKLKRTIESGTNTNTQETSLSTDAPLFGGPEHIDPNDMESLPDPTPQSADTTFDEPALFPCMWRPQWRDQCQHMFDAKEDLERHILEHFRDLLAQ